MHTDFDGAARRALFGPEPSIPGAGTSAAKERGRHTRLKITINLDSDIVEHYKERANQEGIGYQQLINQALREHIDGNKTERVAREVGALLLGDPSFLDELSTRLES